MDTAKRKWVPYIFLSPYLLFYLVLGLIPIIFSFYVSLTSWDGISGKTFVGLANYKYLFNPDSYFFQSIGNTLFFILLTLPLQIVFRRCACIAALQSVCEMESVLSIN